jgi:hypothetical protein
MDRPTAPFTVFYRAASGEGGFACRTCAARRHGNFDRVSDVFAVATQHLNLCRVALRGRPLEGVAILDGAAHGLVLREGLMIVALPTVFDGRAVRLIA